MRGLPAICSGCAIVFEDQMLRFSSASNISVRRQSTRCPKCGGPAELLSGTYKVSADVVESLTGSVTSAEIVRRLNAIRHDLSSGANITDDVISALEVNEPRLADFAKLLKNKRWGAAVLAVLIYVAITRLGSAPPITFDMSTHTTIQVQERPVTHDNAYTYYWQPKLKDSPPSLSGHNRERMTNSDAGKDKTTARTVHGKAQRKKP